MITEILYNAALVAVILACAIYVWAILTDHLI